MVRRRNAGRPALRLRNSFALVRNWLLSDAFAVVSQLIPSDQSCGSVAGFRREYRFLICSLLAGAALTGFGAPQSSFPVAQQVKAVVDQYCVGCHDDQLKKGGLDLESISRADIREHSGEWERVIRKLRSRQMPPIGKERRPAKAYDEGVARLGSCSYGFA